MVFASDSTICRPASQSPPASLPSRITPALLASIVRLPWRICGSSLAMKMVTGSSGGKMAGLNVIVSPFCASSIAWRNVPGPLSAGLVTSRVLPWGAGVGVAGSCIGVGDASVRVGATVVAVGCSSVCVGISGAAVGVSLGIQAESASITAIMRGKIAFFIISLTCKRHL